MSSKTIDEGIEIFRRLKDPSNNKVTAKIVTGDDELLDALNDGWEVVREMSGERFLMKLID